MRRLRMFGAVFATAIAMVLPSLAHGHAMLESGEPAVGSTVQAAPKRVRLHFTQPLERAFSTIHVEDASGKAVDLGDTTVDPGDGTVLQVSVPDLRPGKYKVIWRAVSVDTHVTEGDYLLTVGR